MKSEISDIRDEIPYLNQATLLNFAATAPIPNFVATRMQEVCDSMREPLGHHFYKSLAILEKGRQKLADLLGASASEVAFTQNTSSSLSAIAQAITWKKDDLILIPRDEFPSNKFVWEYLKNKYGTKVIYIDPIRNEPIVETIKKLDLDLNSVRLLSISPVSYRTGRLYELKELVDFCKTHNILSCFDAIQAVGVIPFNVRDLGVDIVVGGAQKWLLGPIGCGYLYIRKDLLADFQSPLVGWCSLEFPEKFELEKQKLADELTQFEPGLPNLFSIAGFSCALDSFFDYGLENIYAQIINHTKQLDAIIASLGLENLRGDHDLFAGIVSFMIPQKYDLRDWQEAFNKEKISITIRDQYIRVSPHYFTTQEEIQEFVSVLENLLDKKAISKNSFMEQAKRLPISHEGHKIFLVTGASGILGQQIVRRLLELGHVVHAQGRNDESLLHLKSNHENNFFIHLVDFDDDKKLISWVNKLKEAGVKFDGLFNCLSHLEVDEMKYLELNQIEQSFKINVFTPYELMRVFINNLVKEDGIGLINIIASSGRCGYPILSHFASSQGALWTLTESYNRELCDTKFSAKIYIAPPMHSKLQKKIGRVALRFFETSGAFDYAHVDIVAKDIVTFFLKNEKNIWMSLRNKIQLCLNLVWPQFIDRKILHVWKK